MHRFGRRAARGKPESRAFSRGVCGAAGLALLAMAGAQPARAVVIKPIFDSSITRLANAAQIESAFNSVAKQFDRSLASGATVNIQVSWGSVAGQALPGADIGASMDNLFSGFTYSDMKSYLAAASLANPLDKTLATAAKDLPSTDPSRLNNYMIPYAEAKALGLAPPTQTLMDGFIGFKNITSYDFNTLDGTTKGYYDFQAIAAHEIEEVLGRITGLQTTRPQWATPLDAFRYTANGVSSFSYVAQAYFSINRGLTKSGSFNYSGGGDRSDWLTLASSADAQDAYLASGKTLSLGSFDWTALDALGWNAAINPGGYSAIIGGAGPSGAASAVPEPATWALVLVGLGLAGAARRRLRKENAADRWVGGV
ncbi:MAG: NF038122 family metalloprotease [Caulobacteraceae bacterium]